MFARINSMGLFGIDSYEVTVECHSDNKLSAFEIVGLPDNAIKEAEEYITKMSYLPNLNSSAARDNAFVETFLSEYAVLFEDVEEVRQYLKGHVNDAPYYWLESKEVIAKIKSMAKAKYTASGYGRAKKIIDDMPAEQVKAYLKTMIEDNIAVGVEIIKGKG